MLFQSAPDMSVTRPSASKNLLGTWNIASISPPSGVQATWRVPASRQTNSPGPTLKPATGPSLSTSVGLFDLDVLVVRQNRAGREPHKCRYEAGPLAQK